MKQSPSYLMWFEKKRETKHLRPLILTLSIFPVLYLKITYVFEVHLFLFQVWSCIFSHIHLCNTVCTAKNFWKKKAWLSSKVHGLHLWRTYFETGRQSRISWLVRFMDFISNSNTTRDFTFIRTKEQSGSCGTKPIYLATDHEHLHCLPTS